MARSNTAPYAPLRNISSIVPIEKGGTGGGTPVDAVTSLGGIHKSKLGVANGLAQLDSGLKIQKSQLPDAVVPFTTLRGSRSLTVNQVAVYKISNYDVTSTYTVSVSAGTVVVTGDTVTLNAPASAQTVNLNINGRVIPIVVGVARPAKPTIAVGSSGIGTNGILIANTSSFAMTSGTGTHRSTDWQIATDPAFNLLVSNIQDDTNNKTALVTSNLSINALYYVRARHRDTLGNMSDWSNVSKVAIGANFILNKEEAKITSFDKGASDYPGGGIENVSVSSDGTRLAYGANGSDSGAVDTGAVYVYQRTGTSWTFEAKLTASDKATSDEFGISVSMSSDGTRIIVGAWAADAGATDTGAAYVFVRSDTAWLQEAKLTAGDKAASDYFGTSVDINSDGTRAVIGAQRADVGAVDTGAAYIFTRSGSVWTQEAKIVPSDKASGDYFGARVKITNDSTRVLVSAYSADVGATDTGAVYVFSRSGSVWTQEAKLTASDRLASDIFGYALAINSDASRVVIGATWADAGATDTGAAYVFSRNGTNWTQEAKLTASDKAANDQFGISVAMSSDGLRIAVGAFYTDVSATDTGSVYMYSRTDTGWIQETKITASNKAASDYFGRNVKLTANADRLFVSAPRADSGNITDSGAIYVYST